MSLFDIFCAEIGRPYLYKLFHHAAKKIAAKHHRSYEVDPSKLEKSDDLKINTEKLLKLVHKILKLICDSADQCPTVLRMIAHFIKNKDGIVAAGGFFFYRLVLPALSKPEVYGIVDKPLKKNCQRGLLLTNQAIQHLLLEKIGAISSVPSYMKEIHQILIFAKEHKHLFEFLEKICAKPANQSESPEIEKKVIVEAIKTVQTFVIDNIEDMDHHH